MALSTPEDVVNAALRDIGFGRPVADLYEGSPAARIALDIYGQTRDELLREKDWRFARRTIALTLLKSADTLPVGSWDESRPIPPWRFEYVYPSDAIIIRNLRPNPPQYEGGESFDPYPIRFDVVSDFASTTATTSQKVVLADQEKALANYTVRLTDLTQWEPSAIGALIKALADKFDASRERLGLPPLASADKQLYAAERQTAKDMADRRRG